MNNQLKPGVRKKKLLLLDTGDNCRCPMAEGYLKKLLHERGIDWIEISTAGVMTPTGLLPTPEAELLLREEGVDISRHRSRPMKVHMLEEADLILGMSSLHVQKAIRESDVARGKTFLLKEYVGYHGKDVQIPDPMGGTMDTFKRVFDQLKDALEKLVETDFIRIPPEQWESERAAAEAEIGPEEEQAQEQAGALEEKESVAADERIAAIEEKLDEEPEEIAPKRRRGRPRKSETGAQPSQPPTPRKRGRPRKTEVTAAVEPAAPKKRGRPRKSETKDVEKTKKAAKAKVAAKPKAKKVAKEKAKVMAASRKKSGAAEKKRKKAKTAAQKPQTKKDQKARAKTRAKAGRGKRR